MKKTVNQLSLFSLATAVWLGVSLITAVAAETKDAPKAAADQPVPVVTVKELMSDPAKLEGQQVVLQGFVTDYCKRRRIQTRPSRPH